MDGYIKYTNILFLDFLSEDLENQIHMNDIINKNINEFIDSLSNIKINDIISKIKDGQEFDLYKCEFSGRLKERKNYLCSIRGIFNEDLILQEIIFIIRSC